MKSLLLAITLSSLALIGAEAEPIRAGNITVDLVWSRASAPRAPAGAIYMVLTNNGSEPDTLIGARTSASDQASLHTHLMDDGVMRMRPVEAIEVAPGEPTVLQPGGLHIMMIGLKGQLKEGEQIPVTLVFEHAGEVEVMSMVESIAATEPSGTHEGHDRGTPHSSN